MVNPIKDVWNADKHFNNQIIKGENGGNKNPSIPRTKKEDYKNMKFGEQHKYCSNCFIYLNKENRQRGISWNECKECYNKLKAKRDKIPSCDSGVLI
jgi:hypothetical protein